MTCHIYVIGIRKGDELTGPCKIGVANNPEARLKELQTACPYDLVLISKHAVPDRNIALQVEDCFHSTQKDHRTRGEWFDLKPTDAAAILHLQLRWLIELYVIKSGDDPERVHSLFEASGVL